MATPYDQPTDPAKRISAELTDGPDRAGARSMLKGTGFTDEDLAKPIIGVATTWIETMPCNLNQRELAQDVKRGIREAGGTPMEFNTIAVSDGTSMGTSGMRASLVSREVIADSIETVARGHLFDGIVCLVACDKTNPAAVMALGRLDIPGLVFYTGSIAPGLFRGREVSVADVYEGIGAYAAGKISAADLHELESVACPGAGACGGQFTANTMSTILEFLGISPSGLNGVPALSKKKAEAAVECGRLVVDLVRRDVRPSQIVTREALENAAASVVATGGSTNGVLHLLAIAYEFGIPFTIDDFDEIAERTPVLADMKPWGRYHATDVYRAGGVALVARELKKRDLVHAGAPTVGGQTLGEVGDASVETAGQDVIASIDAPIKASGTLRILRGNLAPEGCVIKLSGHDRRDHRGPARVFDSEEECFAAVKARQIQAGRRRGHPLRGPARRPRHARDAPRHGGDRRRRAQRRGRAGHRRALLRRHARVHGRARRTGGLQGRTAGGAARGGHDRDRRGGEGASRRALRRRDRSPSGRHRRTRSPATRRVCSRNTRRWSRLRPTGPSHARRSKATVVVVVRP